MTASIRVNYKIKVRAKFEERYAVISLSRVPCVGERIKIRFKDPKRQDFYVRVYSVLHQNKLLTGDVDATIFGDVTN